VNNNPAGVADEWPEPEPLDPLPAVQRFDEALLPDALRPFVLDAAERMQIQVDLPAVVAVAALAGVVNHRAVIQPKQWDTTWTVTKPVGCPGRSFRLPEVAHY
jgi:hypothetical protein